MDKFYRSFLIFFVLGIPCFQVHALQAIISNPVEVSATIKLLSDKNISTGGVVDYAILVKNEGNVEAKNLRIEDLLSTGIVFLNSSEKASIQDQKLSWEIPFLGIGEEFQILMTVMITQQSGNFGNSLTVYDSNQALTSSVSNNSIDLVDLKVTQEVNKNTVNKGKPVVYKIAIENLGTSVATDVEVTDILPVSIQYNEAFSSKGSVTFDKESRMLTNHLGILNPGEKVLLEINGTAAEKGRLTNSAIVKSLENDSNELNNIAEVSHQQVDLFIPNTFTPNGDGRNDVWEIPDLLVVYPTNRLTIVNRWGVEIFKTSNYKNDWNGSNLLEGTYYYQLVGIGQGGAEEVYTGYLTLLR